MKRLIISFVILISSAYSVFAQQTYKVLFLGNSYTYFNDLPEQLYQLALAGGDTIKYESNSPGGCSLGHPDNGHLYNSTSLNLIAQEGWDFVILQDQSQMPVIPHFRDTYTYPGGEALYELIKQANPCAEALFFMTWGRKVGGQQCIDEYCSTDFTDFEHMQDSLELAYMHMGNTLNSPVCPVGIAWKNSILNGDPYELFSSDGAHPSPAGTYLAACTFYASILKKSPEGLEFYGLISEEEALYFQEIAANIVLEDPEQWNLYLNHPTSAFDVQFDGPTIHCTDQSEEATAIHWDFGDGTTSTDFNPSHLYTEDGSYELIQTVSEECFSDSSKRVIDILYYSVENHVQEDVQLKYYSSENQLKIINGKILGDQISVNIFSDDGRLLHTSDHKTSDNLSSIRTPQLSEGILFFQLKSGSHSFSKKIAHYR